MTQTRIALMCCQPVGSARCLGVIERLAVLTLALLLLAFSGQARANCNATSNYSTITVTFPPTTITLPTNPYPGLVFWTSPPQLVAGTTQGNCTSNTPNGLTNQAGPQPASGDDTLFPIGNTGLSYRILLTGNNYFPNTANGIAAYGDQSLPAANNVNFNGSAQLQLVLSDPSEFASSNLVSGSLGHWDVYGCVFYFFCAQAPVVQFNTSTITFVTPACNDPSVTVTLPTVLTSAFSGTSSTTGQTPFSVPLTCSGAVNLAITMTTNAPAGPQGVIANTAVGSPAQNVGVQLLDGSCTNAVAFGTSIPEGKASKGANNLSFCARYYQTGAPVTGGLVQAVATYTLTYP